MSTRVAGEIVGGVPGVFALACAYDLSGNRTSLVAVAAGGAATNTTTYLYGSGNRLLSDASAATTNTYAYDGAGRLTNHVVNGLSRTFAYDFLGRMTTLVDTNGAVFRYTFDAEGNRRSQSLNDCLETRFLYDGPDVLLELETHPTPSPTPGSTAPASTSPSNASCT